MARWIVFESVEIGRLEQPDLVQAQKAARAKYPGREVTVRSVVSVEESRRLTSGRLAYRLWDGPDEPD